MKTSFTFLLLVSLFSTPVFASSKIYYLGYSEGSLNSLMDSPYIEEVFETFKNIRVLKIKSSQPEELVHLSSVDYVEENTSVDISLGKPRSKVDGLDEIESFAEPIVQGDYPWGVNRIEAPRAWSAFNTTGSGVRVLVLDTGIQQSHPAISDRIITSRDFTKTVPDTYVPFAYHDIPGHGTHVATTIAGNGFNKLFGVAPDVDLYIGKVCVYLCITDAIIAGLDWAVEEKFDVVNMSFSSARLPRRTIDRIFQMLEVNNTLAVASAGNSGRDEDHQITFPGAVDTVLAVGASDKSNLHADFSSQGDAVSLLAPGVDIQSASPVKGPESTELLIKTLSGTSMASPHAAGVGALIKQKRPFMRVSEIRGIIKRSATKSMLSETKPTFYGSGILNAYQALQTLEEF